MTDRGYSRVASVRLCGCRSEEDQVGNLILLQTCPWCMSLALTNVNSAIRLDRGVSVSALDEDEDSVASTPDPDQITFFSPIVRRP